MNDLAQLMATRAEALKTKVEFLPNINNAIEYAVKLLIDKGPTTLLLDGFKTESASIKTMAAPGLSGAAAEYMARLCAENGIKLVENLREYAPGIDVGFTVANCGIADTATAILATNNDNESLATMISEINIMVLPVSKIKRTSHDLSEELTELMNRPGMVSFISGCSRTGDIELVMALGAHGPLEAHFLLLEDM